MKPNPLSRESSARICSHMNKDHQEAVLGYARHYGGIPTAKKAKMLDISPNAMELEVDGVLIEISFDHVLTDSKDAHQTLVGMLKAIPSNPQ